MSETNTHDDGSGNGQPFAPTVEITRSSEFLRSLARRYILDPMTSVGTIRIEPSGYGVVEMTITLKVTDTV